jgi:perosamine synthetase
MGDDEMKAIRHNKPFISGLEAKNVNKVLQGGMLAMGPEVVKFENNLKKHSGKKYAVAISNGTFALHLSLLAVGVTKGDEVVLPSFAPSDLLNALNYVGAKPVLVDVQRNGFNLDIEEVFKKVNKKTKAIVVPHMFGIPAQIEKLKKLNIPVINDSAQSIGAKYKGKKIESYGDITVLSFYASKLLTTGQGGMILTDNKIYYHKVLDLIDYNGPLKYKTRFNYPMTAVAAAIGNAQFAKLDKFIARRKAIAKKYQSILEKKGINFYPEIGNGEANYYRFILKFESELKRNEAKNMFKRELITTIVPLNKYEILHSCLNLPDKDFPFSTEMARTTLSIPVYPALKNEEVKRIGKVLMSL